MALREENGKVYDENGNIAVAYYQTIPQVVKVRGSTYLFTVKANICLAFVAPEHVEAVLGITKECCNGTHHATFHLPSLINAKRWVNNGGGWDL